MRWFTLEFAPLDGTLVILRIRHRDYYLVLRSGDDAQDYQQDVVARWIDFPGIEGERHRGWTWNGIMGRPLCWRPYPAE